MNNNTRYGIIEQLPCGRIRQIGMTKEQQELLKMSMAAISESTQPFAHMPEQYDLVLKSDGGVVNNV
ncbi:hypothetical protein [Psychrobacter pygoscelis]|uniref:hypothetical protein n=1 Tax=Psychrobacter pygoscelis TaxID=2488563 RepID=UPI00103E82BE|nr:hypothetical protein [Psychrobacter pygoscelis]